MTFQELKSSMTCADVLAMHGVQYKGKPICCPLHADKTPSFGLYNRNTKYKCFGCGASGDAIDLEMGISRCDIKTAMDNLKDKKTGTVPVYQHKERKAKGYEDFQSALDYHQRKLGKPTVVWKWGGVAVARWNNPKTFRPFHKKGNLWYSGRGNDVWPLYSPSGLTTGTVIVVEGEKACDAAASIGLRAVTWAGGSFAVKKSDWSTLANERVIIIPDSDMAGRDAAHEIADMLNEVYIWDWRPYMDDGYDIADWVAEGGTIEKLREMYKIHSERGQR